MREELAAPITTSLQEATTTAIAAGVAGVAASAIAINRHRGNSRGLSRLSLGVGLLVLGCASLGTHEPSRRNHQIRNFHEETSVRV
jgi:hypothetical protein